MNNRNIFWGVLLVIIGFLFLADNLDWVNFDISLRAVARFWPLMFIFAGVAALVSGKRSPLTPIMIAIAIPLALFHFVDDKVHRVKSDIEDSFNFDNNNDDNDNHSSNGSAIKQDYGVDFGADVKEAQLNLKGGVAKFDLDTASTKLFFAKTELERGNYTLSEDTKDGIKAIDFELKGNKHGEKGFHFNLDNDADISNKVHLKLNKNVPWSFDMGIGAGDVEFDLTPFIVKKINLETGAAAIDLKIGDRAEKTDIHVKSGVASVEIKVPQSVGCEIKSSGALSSNDFDGFEKNGSVYRTAGFDKSTKKIYIDTESGLSSMKVSRY